MHWTTTWISRIVLSDVGHADTVLMDLPNLKVFGDWLEPRRYLKVIEYVFVNGVAGEGNALAPGPAEY